MSKEPNKRELTGKRKEFLNKLKAKTNKPNKEVVNDIKPDISVTLSDNNFTIDWFTALEDIKTALIYTMGLKNECDRVQWFKDFTGYEGKLKHAPTELFEKVYYYLSDKITATKVYLLTKPLIEARKSNPNQIPRDNESKSDINNQIISDINNNEGFSLSSGEGKIDPQSQVMDDSYIYVENDEDLKASIAPLGNEKVLAIDTETTGLNPHCDKLRLIQIASENNPTFIIDCFKCDVKLLQPLLINDSIKVFHNAKFDIQFLMSVGLEISQTIFDTQLAHQLINSGKPNIKASLKAISEEYLGIELDKSEQISDFKSDMLSDSQLRYGAIDAKILLPLREKLKEEIVKWDLVRVAKIEFDCVLATAHKEYNGLLLDVAKWQNIVKEVEERVKELNKIIQPLLPSENTLFPVDINLSSPKQLLSALQKLGLPITDTQTSTLEKYILDYPEIIKPLLEYKELSHFSKHFGESLIKKINPITGRIHGQYLQLKSYDGNDSGGSDAGRYSCKNPNLQQIPKDKKFRSCFVASPNHKLVIADFSQFQIRIGAEIANDKTLIEAIKNNTDLHKLTASLVLGKDIETVTKEERQLAKAINFGILFGLGANGLRRNLKTDYNIDISENEAKDFINKFFANYKGLGKFAQNIKRKLNRGEKILITRTLSNRLRHFEKGSGYTTALNTPVQGSEADIVKLSLGKLVSALKPFNGKARLLASIHDEIILEAHEDIAEDVAKTLSEVMVNSGKEFLKRVPIEADSSIGNSWADK